MTQPVLIGIAAGLACALLFLSPFGGPLLAVPLFTLTGLPIVIVGLGWGAIAALAAGASGSTMLFGLVNWGAAAIFALMFAAPLVWLTWLATLWREVGSGDTGEREWYPLGQLLARAAVAAAGGLVAIGVIVGFDPPSLVEEMTAAMVDWLSLAGSGPPPTAAEVEPFVRFNVAVMPSVLGVIALLILVLNLWLGAIVARMSGRLTRSRDTLWSVELPVGVAIGFAVALLLSLLPGPFGYAAQAFAGALGGAAALVGLAVLHALTIGMTGRAALLTLTYIVVVVSGFAAILLALVGVGETFLNLRARQTGAGPRS